MAGKNQGGSFNPFDMLRNLGDLRDMRKVLGDDFFKGMPFPNIQQGTAYEDDDDESFPRVDVYERGPEIVAIFEIPGVARASDISLSVRSDHIYVRGTIAEAGFRADHVIISERHHGPFERHVPLPVRVIADRVNATYRNGLLMVRLEKYGQDDPESQNFVTIQFEDDSDNQTRSRGK